MQHSDNHNIEDVYVDSHVDNHVPALFENMSSLFLINFLIFQTLCLWLIRFIVSKYNYLKSGFITSITTSIDTSDNEIFPSRLIVPIVESL